MKTEERVRYLRRAASRAEGEGNLRVARLLRLLADDVATSEFAPGGSAATTLLDE